LIRAPSIRAAGTKIPGAAIAARRTVVRHGRSTPIHCCRCRPKTSISLRLDRDVLECFKAQGPGDQTRINSVLRAFRDASMG
jgi:uncharacterized protein (DUF4415 family)